MKGPNKKRKNKNPEKKLKKLLHRMMGGNIINKNKKEPGKCIM